MLIYERKKKIKDHSKVINPKEDLVKHPMYAELLKQINGENIIQKLESILFSEEYSAFALSLIKATKNMPRESSI